MPSQQVLEFRTKQVTHSVTLGELLAAAGSLIDHQELVAHVHEIVVDLQARRRDADDFDFVVFEDFHALRRRVGQNPWTVPVVEDQEAVADKVMLNLGEGQMQIVIGGQIADDMKQRGHDIEATRQLYFTDVTQHEFDRAATVRCDLFGGAFTRAFEHGLASIDSHHLIAGPREGAGVDAGPATEI